MGMGFTGITVAQLKEMMPDAMRRFEGKSSSPFRPEPESDGCGLCPSCRAFVYARFDQPGGLAVCPSCGGSIKGLEPFETVSP